MFVRSETNRLDTGLLVEAWEKGLIWDKALGYYWLPLTDVQYSNEVSREHIEPAAVVVLTFLTLVTLLPTKY